MEIERKFVIFEKPDLADAAAVDHLEQAYISTSPVIRVRRKNQSFFLTVKSEGLLAREEYEFPISEESYRHLLKKKDGIIIEKDRCNIPCSPGLTIELDLFFSPYQGFMMAEVEFPDLETASSFNPPDWFGPEVTEDPRFQNSSLCLRTPSEIREFLCLIEAMEKENHRSS